MSKVDDHFVIVSDMKPVFFSASTGLYCNVNSRLTMVEKIYKTLLMF